MSKEKVYDVNCPRGYDFIKFLVIGSRASCPVSGAVSCFRCDIATRAEAREAGKRVMKEKK